METSDIAEVVVKKEPCDNESDDAENNIDNRQIICATSDNSTPTSTGPLRYVSRRGRPPGGGYSMKSHAHYVSFSSTPLTTSTELGRQTSLASSSSLSPQDLLKNGGSTSSDTLDIRRFGFQGFDSDKNSFRCDGCDVIFSSRDTYAMHMLLRAKNESCVALPTSAISSNPENPTPREKFERELRQQAMITALRNQAAAMSKAAAAMMPKSNGPHDTLSSLNHLASASTRDDISLAGSSGVEGSFNFSSLFSMDAYGLYVDPRQYRRFLEEYGLRTSASTGSLASMMEQLSCSVCGELFSNKDALAMHMMFHTREEENDTKPPVAWPDGRVSVNVASTLSSTPFSTMATSETKESFKTDSSRQRETDKSGDRELTAERVAELKRMAIESSLRSPSKKTAVRQSSRPKSVSQDMVVTSTAQTRPLSADDAMRLTKFGPKGAIGAHSPIASSNRDNCGTIVYKRRRFATTDDDSVFEVRQMSADPLKHKRMRHEGSLYEFFYRNNNTISAPLAPDGEGDPKVCDNHVSSASGPQDSDETSEGSSGLDQESKNNNKADIGQTSDFTKVRDIPYLEAIMSQDAVLIPLGTSDREEDRNKYPEERTRRKENASRFMQSSALDFSIGSRERRENTFNMAGWYNGEASRDSVVPSEIQPSQQSNKMLDRSEYRRNVFNQYPSLTPGAMGRLEIRSQTSSSGSPQAGRQEGTVSDHSDTVGTQRNFTGDSTSRVGEARYCPHCEILFLDVTLFHLHMGLHNVNNPWQCNTCGLVCSGRLEFNTHVLHY